MSELERVGRLPVFVDEEQWARAFEAAKHEMRILYHSTNATIPSTADLDSLAVRIATAALRAAAQDADEDISTLPGVSVAQMPNQTTNYQVQAANLPPITVRPGDAETEWELRMAGWNPPTE